MNRPCLCTQQISSSHFKTNLAWPILGLPKSNEINAEVYQKVLEYLKPPLLCTQWEECRYSKLEQESKGIFCELSNMPISRLPRVMLSMRLRPSELGRKILSHAMVNLLRLPRWERIQGDVANSWFPSIKTSFTMQLRNRPRKWQHRIRLADYLLCFEEAVQASSWWWIGLKCMIDAGYHKTGQWMHYSEGLSVGLWLRILSD